MIDEDIDGMIKISLAGVEGNRYMIDVYDSMANDLYRSFVSDNFEEAVKEFEDWVDASIQEYYEWKMAEL